MGAAALAADAGGFCLPLVVGSAVGSACGSAQERCGNRICVMEAPLVGESQCAAGMCNSPEAPCTVSVAVHVAEVVQGVVGSIACNEPVIGIRARSLPYTQAVGRRSPGDSPALVPQMLSRALGDAPAVQRYAFGNMQFTLPDMVMQDEVVIAFGTRTVVRLPLLGATNAPLDFDVLGSVRLTLGELLGSPQPVEILVPIRPRGESLPQVARSSLSFRRASPPSGIHPRAPAQAASFKPLVVHEQVSSGSGVIVAPAVKEKLRQCDSAEIEREICALEEQLQFLKKRPLPSHTVDRGCISPAASAITVDR